MSWVRRNVGWLALVLAVVVVALVGGRPDSDDADPLSPDSTEPDGTRALVLLLEELGADVEQVRGTPEDADTALLLSDSLDEEATADLEAWVDEGGTLLVADPRSDLTPEVLGSAEASLFGIEAERGLARGCDLPALRGVDEIDPAGGALFRRPSEAVGCFAEPLGAQNEDEDGDGDGGEEQDDEGHFLVAEPYGSGTIVSIGGPEALVNGRLGERDNAALAAALLAPRSGTRVAFLLPPPPGGGDEQLVDLVPGRVFAGLWQLLFAFAALVLWKARRFGRPALEPQAVQIPGSELTAAVGNLAQRAGRRDQASMVLRDDLRRSLAERLGLGADASPEVVAEVAATRTGVDRGRLQEALAGGPVADEAGLVALAQAVEMLRQEVSRAR